MSLNIVSVSDLDDDVADDQYTRKIFVEFRRRLPDNVLVRPERFSFAYCVITNRTLRDIEIKVRK